MTGLMRDQIPLDNEASLNLEQQRDQFSRQLAELDQQISENKKIIELGMLN